MVWPGVGVTSLGEIGLRELLGHSSVGGDAKETGAMGWRENDRVIGRPASAYAVRSFRDGEGRAALHGHLLELPCGEEPDPFAIRGKERRVRTFGSRKLSRLEAIERPKKETGPLSVLGGVGQEASIR